MIDALVSVLRGERIGLLANQASLLSGRPTLQLLRTELGARLVALFAPEHGWTGFGEDALPMPDAVEGYTGLPVHSLYGPRRGPPPHLLSELDTVIVDLQDVGVRCYTYAASLALLLESAAAAGVRVVVLDRPNLLGPKTAGPMLEPGLRSFLAYLAVPFQHGLTLGELARWNSRTALECAVDLEVVTVPGWRRNQPRAGLFVPPSPGLPSHEAVTLYPGMVLLEAVNLSEGRGTPLPFQLLGAPWLEEYKLAKELASLELPGLLFRPLTFVPESGPFAREACRGVHIHIVDPEQVSAFEALVRVLTFLYSQYEDFTWVDAATMPWSGSPDAGEAWHEPVEGPLVDGLTGSTEVRTLVEGHLDLDERIALWREQSREFLEEASRDLLYEPAPS